MSRRFSACLEVAPANLDGVVLSHRVAKPETGVLLVVGEDVRDTERIATDLQTIGYGALAGQRRPRADQHGRAHQRRDSDGRKTIAHGCSTIRPGLLRACHESLPKDTNTAAKNMLQTRSSLERDRRVTPGDTDRFDIAVPQGKISTF